MTVSTFRANISGSAFARASKCVSSEETRYYLHGVHIEPCRDGPGALLVATDGSVLVVIHDPEGWVEPGTSGIVTLPPALLKACSGKGDPRLEIEGGEASVAGMSAKGVLIDGTYPDWRRVIPDQSEGDTLATSATFDVRLYKRLADAIAPSSGKSAQCVALYGSGRNPHVMIGNDPNAFGVIMPIYETIAWRSKPAFLA